MKKAGGLPLPAADNKAPAHIEVEAAAVGIAEPAAAVDTWVAGAADIVGPAGTAGAEVEVGVEQAVAEIAVGIAEPALAEEVGAVGAAVPVAEVLP